MTHKDQRIIEASGVEADAWIDHHSAAFRAANEGAMRVEESSPASILILHPHPLVRAGIVASLHRHGSFKVFEDGPDRVNWRGTRFDIVIADLGQAMRLAGAGRDTAGSPHARILVLASEDGVADIRRAIEADIHGYLLLGDPLSEFIEAAMTLARGGRYLGRSLAGRVAQSLARESLTSREIGVLQLVVAGESNKAIARRLCIELGTVKTHMNGILRKLDATSRTHAAAIAVSQGLVSERMPVPAAGVSSRVPRAGHSAHPA